MASSDLNIALVLKLVDQLTGPIKPALAALRQVEDRTAAVGRSGVDWSNRQLATNQARTQALRGETMGVLALGAGLVAMTEPAIQAERRMAEIAKVVDFEGADGFSILRNDILDLVTSDGLATTAEGVEDIIAAAGRMGVVDANLPDAEKRAELLEFAIAASKMSVAFGISADEAATSLARWRENLGLSQSEAMLLGDTVNFLGNTMATNEADILTVINRMGVVAQTSGLAENQIAALSATLLAAGSSPEIASTGMKNFLNTLTRGESVTERQRAVFEALGIDAVEMARRMQDDAGGGMMQLLDAFEKIEPYRRTSLVGDLFGEEAKGAIMPLIANAEMLRATLANTTDSASLLGLMEIEYQSQAATTFAQRQRLFEYVKGLSIVIGGHLLPALNDLMATVMPVVGQMTAWADAHPELISGAFKLAAGFVAFRVASIGLRFALFTTLTPILHMIRAGSWMLAILPRLVGGFAALLNPMKLVRGAFYALRIAFIATGIGALVAGLAMAGVWIYNNWDGLKTFFVTFGAAFMEALGPARPLVEGIVEKFGVLWDAVKRLVGPLDASAAQWAEWGTTAGRVTGEAITAVVDFVSDVIQWFKDLPNVDWKALIPEFSWAGVLKVLDWVSWLSPIRWLDFISSVDWKSFLPDVNWSQALTALDWLKWLSPIRWLEFIPDVDWASWLPRIDWTFFVPAFGWATWLVAINWLDFIPEFDWSDVLPDIDWAGIVNLQGIKDALGAVTSWVDEKAASLWDALPDMPNLKFWGDDDIEDPKTLLAAAAAAERLEEQFPAIREAAEETLGNAQITITTLSALLVGTRFTSEGADMIQSLADGMLSKLSVIHNAAAKIGNAIRDALPASIQTVITLSGGNTAPGRDSGGPVRAGQPYIVGERERELFIPGTSGTILPTRALRAAMAASAIVATSLPTPSMADIETNVDRRPALSAQATSAPVTNRVEVGQIVIQAAPGMSAEDIAYEVRRQIEAMQDTSGDLHDGGNF